LLGPIPIPLFSIEDTNWIAPGYWLVKAYQPSKAVDLSLLGIPPFYIPGRTIDIVDQIVNVDNNNLVVNDFQLYQNYPNPFNPTTSIQYAVGSLPDGKASTQLVQLKIYDVLGNEVATLVNEEKAPGKYEVEFNATQLPSGFYLYRLTAGDFVQTKKMILIK
jgi:hypothetical protein